MVTDSEKPKKKHYRIVQITKPEPEPWIRPITTLAESLQALEKAANALSAGVGSVNELHERIREVEALQRETKKEELKLRQAKLRTAKNRNNNQAAREAAQRWERMMQRRAQGKPNTKGR